MRLLLLNNNPAVSRLIKLSVDKVGYEMDEFDDYGLVPLKNYDVIMVDNEMYDEEELNTLRDQAGCQYFIYIGQRGSLKPEMCNVALEKPFLPTDFLALLEKVKNVISSLNVDESKEAVEVVEKNDDVSTMQAYDIDEIDTFGDDEDDVGGFDMLEDKEEDLSKPEEYKLDLEEIDPDESSAMFEEKPALESELDVLKEVSSSILDKDDIDEVKQLLDEDDVQEDFDFSLGEEDLELEDDAQEGIKEGDKELSLDAEEEKDEALFESTEDTGDDIPTLENLQEPFAETQDEIIDDFRDEIEEKIEEEDLQPEVALDFSLTQAQDIESLDALSENLLKQAFGEEIEEEALPQEATQEIEVIRGEIENSIARSISSFAQSDILREALKGMKINISITFDEKN